MRVYRDNKCIFCKNFKDKALSYWISTINNTIVDILIDKENVILYESEHFYVIPDIAPLTIGHVLIVSKNHINSMTKLSRCMALELRNLVNIIDPIISCNHKTNVVYFEHGPGDNQSQSLKSVNHFHLHCVPTNIDITSIMHGYEKYFVKKVSDYEDIVGCDIKDYIYCESNEEKYLYILDKSKIKSQLLRERIFQCEKQERFKGLLDDYDWKKEYNIAPYRQSKEFLVEAFGGIINDMP